MNENNMTPEGVEEEYTPEQEAEDRAKLGSMRIDRTVTYNEKKKANLEAQLRQFKETNTVPFAGVEDDDAEEAGV